MKYQKYKKGYHAMKLKDRTWPDNEIKKAPMWCSVDLRDGNQALITPMNLEEKIEFFSFLVEVGFKNIEVGFPAASETEFQFVRTLIEKDMIPDDVYIQVLTQARPHIIRKTVEALRGVKNAVVHLYNSTSTLQRRVVFKMEKDEIIKIAVDGTILVKELVKELTDAGSHIQFEYSPESFTGTEPDYAVEICNAVLDAWQPDPVNKAIINLPATIELSSPNVYADQVEYFCRNVKNRESVIISVHPHNDRGEAVAATELAMLAGADRVEGTLFGNGERTGNADVLVMALNLFSQGIDPGLKLDNMDEIIEVYEQSTRMDIPPRHPYAGELVYTAFSGSHQDAIKKSMDVYYTEKPVYWENPYLPVNPEDLGRKYEPVRINSQSGKGGVAFVLSRKFGYVVPKAMVQEYSYIVTDISDRGNQELKPELIHDEFKKEYVNIETIFKLGKYSYTTNGTVRIEAEISKDGKDYKVTGNGNGPLDAFNNALKNTFDIDVDIADYSEHALERGATSKAAAYIAIKDRQGGICWGCGVSTNISTASIKAMVSAVNRMYKEI